MEKEKKERFAFREVCFEEQDEVTRIEQICFPPNEACSETQMKERVEAVPELFLVAVEKSSGKIAGFLNGLATDEEVFRDEFFRMQVFIKRMDEISCCLDWMFCRNIADRDWPKKS